MSASGTARPLMGESEKRPGGRGFDAGVAHVFHRTLARCAGCTSESRSSEPTDHRALSRSATNSSAPIVQGVPAGRSAGTVPGDHRRAWANATRIAPWEPSSGVALFLIGVILLDLGVDSLVVVVGAFLGVGVVDSMIGFGGGGGDQ